MGLQGGAVLQGGLDTGILGSGGLPLRLPQSSEVHGSERAWKGCIRGGGVDENKDQDEELRAARRWGRNSRGRSKGSQQVQTKSKGSGEQGW